MRKGEKRRADILRVAEQFFYQQGYEATTIQDILDVLRLSKGGFYHHFESKEQLLEAICEQKLGIAAAAARRGVEAAGPSSVDKLNALLEEGGIWKDENTDFLALLIRIAYRDDNLTMRERFKRMSMAYMQPLLETILEEGLAAGFFAAPNAQGVSRIVLSLCAGLNDEMAYELLRSPKAPPNVGVLLDLLELYRRALERILDAPYGSVTIYQMGPLAGVLQGLWHHHAKALYM